MRKLLLPIVLLTLFSSSAFAQLNEFYRNRELNASEAVKTKLINSRAKITSRQLKFTIAYTTVSDKNVSELTGYKLPTISEQKIIADKLKTKKVIKYEFKLPAMTVNAKKLDLRNYHLVTPVRAQACGSCWAHAVIGSFESNFLMNNPKETYTDTDPNSPKNLDLSEQQI